MRYTNPLQSTLWPLILASTLAIAAGCGSDDNGRSQTGPLPAIAIALSAGSATIAQGASSDIQVTITPSGGFTGTAELTLGGAPSGVSASVGNRQTSAGVTTATVTISVALSTAPGTYSLTLTGTGPNVVDKHAPFTLIVAAVPHFSIELSPAAMSVVQGGTGTATVTIHRTDYTGAVTLSSAIVPQGVTLAFDPVVTTGTTSTLTVTSGATVHPVTYDEIEVHGEGAGLPATYGASAPFTLTVTPAAVGGFDLSMAQSGVSVVQGASTNATVNISRHGGFTGPVALTITGAPAGISATPSPASADGNSSSLDIVVASSVPVGAYTLFIHGNSGALAGSTTSIVVSVTTP